jgi:hypothetical protein
VIFEPAALKNFMKFGNKNHGKTDIDVPWNPDMPNGMHANIDSQELQRRRRENGPK